MAGANKGLIVHGDAMAWEMVDALVDPGLTRNA